MRLSSNGSSAVTRVLGLNSDNFGELSQAAGLRPEIDFKGAFLKGVDFSGSDLSGFDFTGAKIVECQFGDCRLGTAVFTDAQFSMTDLSRAIDWRDRNSYQPILYRKWSPEDYYSHPVSTKTMGKVVALDGAVAVVNVGGGLCRRFQAQSLKPMLESRAVSLGDTVALSEDLVDASPAYFYDIDIEKVALTWNDVVDAHENQTIIRGMIYRAVKGGFLVNIAVFKAFLPASQVDKHQYQNIAELMDDPQPFVVTGLGGLYPDDIVVSRREAIEIAETEMRELWLRDACVGDEVEGVVTGLEAYGAFVDIGGLVALLPNDEVSHERVRAMDVLQLGETLRLKIVKLNHEKARLTLSRKALLPDPWTRIEFHVGQVVTATVTNVVSFGAFMRIGPFEGLLHNSELGYEHGMSAQEMLKSGEELQVKIIHVSPERHRISFSLKALLPDPWDSVAARYQSGQILTGTIQRLYHYGVFVGIESGVSGLVHVSQMEGWHPIGWGKKHMNLIDRHIQAPVRIVRIDGERRRIELSFDPPDNRFAAFAAVFPPGSIVEGISSTDEKGATTVELTDGLHASLEGSAAQTDRSTEDDGEPRFWKVVKVDVMGRSISVSVPD